MGETGGIILRHRGFAFPDDLLYSRHHVWARVDGHIVTVGITDFMQRKAGEIVYVELPPQGQRVEHEKPCLSFESGKWVGRLYSPFTGEVTKRNLSLEDDPSLLNSDPYGKGWIIQVKAEPELLEKEMAQLMKPGPELVEFINSEIARISDTVSNDRE